MSRKKTARRIRQAKKPNLSFMKMEQDFQDAPGKLTILLNKQIDTIKKKENKLKNVISKINAQAKKTEAKLLDAAQVKNASVRKKRLATAKKGHHKIMSILSDLNKELKEITKTLEHATKKQSKLAALRKHLTQFEKDWAKSSKQMKLKSKPHKENNKIARVKPKPTEALVEEPQFETFETSKMNDDAQVNETLEITS